MKVDPASAKVKVDGVPLPTIPGLVYYLLYKPRGVVSTASDPGGRPIVTDLVPDHPRVYPVGRLDADSEGLLVLTNDGDLTYLVTHPRFEVEKTYVARVEEVPTAGTIRRITKRVTLEDGPARALRARLVAETGSEALIEVVMGEGRKREVRRLFEAVGHPVTRLVRTAVGPVRDPDLKPGAWRPLTVGEIRALYESASVPWDDAVPESDEET